MSKRNFKEKEKSVTGPRWAPDTKIDWPTDCRSQINFNFNFNKAVSGILSVNWFSRSDQASTSRSRVTAVLLLAKGTRFWQCLIWHGFRTKFHKYRFNHSSNIKVLTCTIWKTAVLVLLQHGFSKCAVEAASITCEAMWRSVKTFRSYLEGYTHRHAEKTL
jgi:hypothetical protein